MKNIDYFLLIIFIYGSAKKPDETKSKEDEQTLAELNSAHRLLQAKCQLVQTSYIKRIKLFLFANYSKHLINREGGLYGRILTEVLSTDRTQ